MDALDIAVRVVAGFVAYTAVGIMLSPIFCRWNDWDKRVNWGLHGLKTTRGERGTFMLFWPIGAGLCSLAVVIRLCVSGIGQLSEWFFPGQPEG